MKLKNVISLSLIIGLFFNTTLTSLGSVLSQDGRYETFEGNNITIDNILEEDKVDVEIQGDTLVNMYLSDTLEVSNSSIELYKNGFKYSISSVPTNTTSPWYYFGYKMSQEFKDNTTYSLIMNVTKNTFKNEKTMRIFRPETTTLKEIIWLKGGQTGLIVTTIDTDYSNTSDWNNIYNFGLYNAEEGELIVEDIMILEGDWSNKKLPEYFKGMKSVGELENNKIEVLSTGKYYWEQGTYVAVSGSICRDTIGEFHKYRARTNFIPLNDTKNIIIKTKSPYTVSVTICNKDKVILSHSNLANEHDILIDNEDAYYVRLVARKNGGTTKIQPYELYNELDCNMIKFNKKDVFFNEPLRGLPNGVKDRIIKKDGKWVVERNCGYVVLNEDIFNKLRWGDDANKRYVYVWDALPNLKSSGYIYTDKIPYTNSYFNSEYFGVRSTVVLIFCFPKEIGTMQEKKELVRPYLQNGGLTVTYELATPTYEPISLQELMTYLDITHISNTSSIPANMKVTVDRAVNKAIEVIELAKENPTIGNISKARMWINLLEESVLKDSLNNKIDNILDIEDLYIEPKKVSGNIDIYVKSDNMLSMSLSTNFIMFDNFTGIDDMELDNALNITVNSSLPYRLNSYLLSDLQNADGSVTMNRDLLNIKINNDIDYKVFTNLNEKVVLEDDCDAGNNNNHIIDFKLNGNNAHKADVYKAVIKFEAEQK